MTLKKKKKTTSHVSILYRYSSLRFDTSILHVYSNTIQEIPIDHLSKSFIFVIPQDHVQMMLEKGEISNIQFSESLSAILAGKFNSVDQPCMRVTLYVHHLLQMVVLTQSQLL